MLLRRFESLLLAPLFLAACLQPHVCTPGCEAGLVPGVPPAESPVESPAETGAPAAPSHPARQASAAPAQAGLTPAAALAAFDEAWQTVHDTHFDPTFNGVDWDALRAELRPRAERARTQDELRAILAEMLGHLGQSHFAVLPGAALAQESAGAHDESGGLGFDVRLRAGRLLVVALEPGGAAAAAGVQAGWSVQRVGAFDVAQTLARLEGAVALGERRLAFNLWGQARAQLLGAPGGSVRVTFLDGAEREVELTLERRARAVTVQDIGAGLPTIYLEFHEEVREQDGRRVGVLRFSNWFAPVVKPLDAAIEHMRGLDGIVLDLRGNTGGAAAMTMGLAGHFFAQMQKLGVMTMRESTVNIVAIPRKMNPAGERVEPFSGPLAIVIDETTGSASEVFAGGMQSLGRARVFGETSAGAVLPALLTRLPNGDTLMHALGDFETATGVRLEGRGVVPDEPVLLERSALLAGRDAPLEAALAWIAGQPPR